MEYCPFIKLKIENDNCIIKPILSPSNKENMCQNYGELNTKNSMITSKSFTEFNEELSLTISESNAGEDIKSHMEIKEPEEKKEEKKEMNEDVEISMQSIFDSEKKEEDNIIQNKIKLMQQKSFTKLLNSNKENKDLNKEGRIVVKKSNLRNKSCSSHNSFIMMEKTSSLSLNGTLSSKRNKSFFIRNEEVIQQCIKKGKNKLYSLEQFKKNINLAKEAKEKTMKPKGKMNLSFKGSKILDISKINLNLINLDSILSKRNSSHCKKEGSVSKPIKKIFTMKRANSAKQTKPKKEGIDSTKNQKGKKEIKLPKTNILSLRKSFTGLIKKVKEEIQISPRLGSLTNRAKRLPIKKETFIHSPRTSYTKTNNSKVTSPTNNTTQSNTTNNNITTSPFCRNNSQIENGVKKINTINNFSCYVKKKKTNRNNPHNLNAKSVNNFPKNVNLMKERVKMISRGYRGYDNISSLNYPNYYSQK
ncbi:MAG: hypothetical protein MJ252_04165 [archaeon]|nr:hypothetical protein [archaeon]